MATPEDATPSAPLSTVSQPLKCLIHVIPAETTKLLRWQQEKWAVVQHAAEARKAGKNYHSSKYKAVIDALPANPVDTDGYHSKCYKNFTAVPSKPHPRPSDNDTVVRETKVLRSATSPSPSGENLSNANRLSNIGTGIFPDTCLFCDKKNKTCADGTKELPGKIQTKQKIIDVANTLKLANVLVKISGIDLIAKEAQCHHSCRAMYIRKADRAKGYLATIAEEPVDSKFPLDCIYSYVKENVIDRQRPERLSSIYGQYTDLCSELEVTPSVGKVQYIGELLE